MAARRFAAIVHLWTVDPDRALRVPYGHWHDGPAQRLAAGIGLVVVAAADLALTEEKIAYLEEPYVPHALVGVMAQNRR